MEENDNLKDQIKEFQNDEKVKQMRLEIEQKYIN
jgi:hypothetical protein